MTEWEKMLGGEPYDGNDPMVLERLFANKDRVWRYNQIQPTRFEEREAALRQMLGRCGERPVINAPFYCDYGCNIEVGDRLPHTDRQQRVDRRQRDGAARRHHRRRHNDWRRFGCRQ